MPNSHFQAKYDFSLSRVKMDIYSQECDMEFSRKDVMLRHKRNKYGFIHQQTTQDNARLLSNVIGQTGIVTSSMKIILYNLMTKQKNTITIVTILVI